MHRTISTLALSLCLAFPAAAADPAPKRDESWKKDVRFLATELPRVYPEGFSAQARKAWDAESLRIANAVPKMSDTDVKVALLRLVASLGDPGTRLQWVGERFFTLTLQSFPDGLRVTRVLQGFDRAVGAKLVKIGDTTIDAAAKELAPFAACEDEACRRDALVRHITSAEILRTVGLAPAEGGVTFSFEDASGPFSLEMHARKPTETNMGLWASAIDPSPEKMPLYLRNREENYWFELLPDSKTLYVQYTRSREGSGRSLKTFVDELFRAADATEVSRLVLDLRRNTATDAAFLRPLIEGLAARPALRAPGKLFVIVGQLTYPAGAENARDLDKRFHAILVGETVPARGRRTGESKSFALPESKLRVTYSVTSPNAPASKALVPEIVAEHHFDDLKNGKDPALDAILARASKGADAAK